MATNVLAEAYAVTNDLVIQVKQHPAQRTSPLSRSAIYGGPRRLDLWAYELVIGHTKTVSYVEDVDASTIVSGSTDNSLNFWDLSMNQARVIDNPIQGFTWHTNTKVGYPRSIFVLAVLAHTCSLLRVLF